MRPTAPQNNPMNVSATGGNGQSGDATQAAKYVPGLPYGEGQALMETQRAASLAAASNIEQTNTPNMGFASAAATPRTPFGAPSERPDEVITSGIDMGPGPDSSILGYGKQEYADRQKFASQMEEYRPALMFMASQPNISPETRNLIRRLFV
jgi:hypothetical protein